MAVSATRAFRSTTEPLRLEYDATNYVSFGVSSTGDLTITPGGGDVSIAASLAVSGIIATGGAITTGALSGDIVIPNNREYRSVDFAGTGTKTMLGLVSSLDQTTLYCNSTRLRFDGIQTSASAGSLAGYIDVVIGGALQKIPYYANS